MNPVTTKARKQAEKRIQKAIASIEKKMKTAAPNINQGSLFSQMDILGTSSAAKAVSAGSSEALEAQLDELKEENAMYEEEVERLTKELNIAKDLLRKVSGKVDGAIEDVEKMLSEAA
jgi:predicted RNase H-like nuclease (RuvC/YqgF family)